MARFAPRKAAPAGASKTRDDGAARAVAAVARHPQAVLEAVCCALDLRAQAPPFTFLYR